MILSHGIPFPLKISATDRQTMLRVDFRHLVILHPPPSEKLILSLLFIPSVYRTQVDFDIKYRIFGQNSGSDQSEDSSITLMITDPFISHITVWRKKSSKVVPSLAWSCILTVTASFCFISILAISALIVKHGNKTMNLKAIWDFILKYTQQFWH